MGIIHTRPQLTFKYFYLGSILIFIGLASIFSINIILSVIICTTGLFILLSIKGFIINPEENRVKSYFNIFFLKFGNWITLDEFTHVVVGPNSSSQEIGKFSNSTFRTNSYSVSLLDQQKKSHELQEFITYENALEYSDFISKRTGLPIINKQELIKNRAAKNRKSRK